MFKSLVDFAKTIRGFLGFASLIVLGLIALFSWLFSRGAFDPIVANFTRLTREQFFTLIMALMILIFVVTILLILLSFLSTRPKSELSNPCIFVVVHEEGDKTMGVEDANVTLSLIPRPLQEVTDKRGSVTFYFSQALSKTNFDINAYKEGYISRKPVKVTLTNNKLYYISLKKVQPVSNKEKDIANGAQIDPKKSIDEFILEISRSLQIQAGNRRTAYPLDMNFRELYEQKVYVTPQFFDITSNSKSYVGIENLINSLKSGRNLLVMGEPGCGKSFFTYLIQRSALFSGNINDHLCIQIDLRVFINLSLQQNLSFTPNAILKTLWESNNSEKYPFADKEKSKLRLLFVVDGIDELSNNPIHVKALIPLLDNLRKLGSLLVTCRTREYELVFAPVIDSLFFDTFFGVKEWEVNIEFSEFLQKLARAGKFIDPDFLEQVRKSASLTTLVKRPLHARMLTFIAKPDLYLRNVAQLYDEYLRKYSVVVDTKLIKESCLESQKTFIVWRSASWYVFEKDIFVHDKIPFEGIELFLIENQNVKQECVTKILSPLFNFSQVFHSIQLQYLHYSFYEYLVAEYIAEGLVEAHKNGRFDIHKYLIKNLTPEISHQLMMVINDTKAASFGKWLAKMYLVVNDTSPNQTARRVANNLIVYILARLSEDIGDEMWNLLAIEKDNFLRNGLYWALCAVVGLSAVKKYLEEMSQNINLAYLNRGYHLYYYNDIDRGKEPPYLDTDPSKKWPNTHIRMIAFMSDPNYHSRVSIGRRVLDLYSFLDLCEFRNEAITDEFEIELLTDSYEKLTDELRMKNELEILDNLRKKRNLVIQQASN